jgi:MSHA biogenesis protein MshJ
MKQLWQRFAARYDRFSGRERLLVLLAGGTLLAALAFSGAMAPMLKDNQALLHKHQALARQLQATQAQQRQLAMQPDPNLAAQQQLAAAQQRLAAVDRQLQMLQSQLVPAGQMANLLERLLHANGRLALVSLKTLPAVPLAADVKAGAAPGKPAGGAAAGLYKHGVEIIVQGNYFDLLAYLQSIEQLPANMIWSDLRFKVDRYPVNTLTLTLYTLSLDRIWLSV